TPSDINASVDAPSAIAASKPAVSTSRTWPISQQIVPTTTAPRRTVAAPARSLEPAWRAVSPARELSLRARSCRMLLPTLEWPRRLATAADAPVVLGASEPAAGRVAEELAAGRRTLAEEERTVGLLPFLDGGAVRGWGDSFFGSRLRFGGHRARGALGRSRR